MKYTTIYVDLTDPNGKAVKGRVIVRKEYALVSFTDPKLAKKLYELQRKQGKDVVYRADHNVLIERWKGKSMEEIVEIITAELKKGGAKLTKA